MAKFENIKRNFLRYEDNRVNKLGFKLKKPPMYDELLNILKVETYDDEFEIENDNAWNAETTKQLVSYVGYHQSQFSNESDLFQYLVQYFPQKVILIINQTYILLFFLIKIITYFIFHNSSFYSN